jgi:hypothetical protein
MQSNPNWFIVAFNDLVRESHILNLLFNAIIFLTVGFYVFTVVRLYSKKMLGEELKISEMLRPFAVFLLIIFWKWIYFKVLVGGFDVVTGFVINNINAANNAETEKLKAQILEASREGELSLMSLSLEYALSFIMKLLATGINIIIDVVIAIYVGVNDILLAVTAPIVLCFTMLDITKDMFVKWLKIFFFFKVFFLMVILGNHLAYQLMAGVAVVGSKALTATLGGGYVPVGSMAMMSLVVLVIFKIIWIMGAYKLLQNLFNGGDTGMGGAANNMAKGIVSAVKMVATKGAAK